MKQQRIERPSPSYRSCVAISRIAYYYEYPKHKELFIWGIPSKYEVLTDREISSLCCCWIYDGSSRSLKAAMEIDSWFEGNPTKFILGKQYVFWLMEQEQTRVVYDNVTIADCYKFFQFLFDVFKKHWSVKLALMLPEDKSVHEKLAQLLSPIYRFSKIRVDSEGRRNLFLFMMVHCFEDYDVPSIELLPPVFKAHILVNCRVMNIVNKKTPDRDLVRIIDEHLRWFSEKNPMTFWVGIAGYRMYEKDEPLLFKKLAKLKMTRHRFNKR